jgi:hypothetical protein
MRKGSLFFSLVCLLSLNGCFLTASRNDIDGKLSVSRSFVMVDKSGQKTTFEAGQTYTATLHMADKGSDFAVKPNAIVSVDALMPEPVADKLGKFEVAASASKQDFDVSGEVAESSSSFPETGADSCILGYEQRLVCRVVEDPKDPKDQKDARGPQGGHGGPGDHGGGHGGSHQECHTETQPIYGHQFYKGTREISDRNASLQILDPASKDVIATYSGSYRMVDVLVDKVMTSGCLPLNTIAP